MARRRILEIEKKCNICKNNDTYDSNSITNPDKLWHRDRKWGKGIMGWICRKCYNSIYNRETRPFLNKGEKITRNRPKGLVYNKQK